MVGLRAESQRAPEVTAKSFSRPGWQILRRLPSKDEAIQSVWLTFLHLCFIVKKKKFFFSLTYNTGVGKHFPIGR